jgi:hypothetical protein
MTADPVEQKHIQLRLQDLDLPGDCGLAEIDLRSRAGDAARVRDCDEAAQLMQVHD